MTDRRRRDAAVTASRLAGALGPAYRSLAVACPSIQRPPLQRLRRRYPGLGAAGERRAARRAQLQAAPAARNFFLRRRGTHRSRRCGRGRPAHSEYARDAGGALRGPASRPASIAGPASASMWARSTASSPRCCRPASTTRPSSGPTGICTSPPFGAWRVSAEPPAEPDPDRYEEVSAQAEVLVIGGGLAGLSAAVAAAEAGARHAVAGERTDARRRARPGATTPKWPTSRLAPRAAACGR